MIRFTLKKGYKMLKYYNRLKYNFCIYKKSKEDLFTTLEEELKIENKNFTKDNQINSFLKENNWELEEKANSNYIILQKILGNTEIKVVFFAKPPPMSEEEKKIYKDNLKSNEDENPQIEYEITEFFVYVKGINKNLCLTLNYKEPYMYVINASMIDDIEKHIDSLKLLQDDRIKYEGPDFGKIDKNLSDSFIDYLNSIGVDENLCVFIDHLASNKEQRLYMNWLEDMKIFFQ